MGQRSITEDVKSVQKRLQQEKTIVFHVEQLRKDVEEVNKFIKAIFQKSNQLLTPKDMQIQIIKDLSILNDWFAQLHGECSSEYHYQLEKDYFDYHIDRIKRMVECLYISVENSLCIDVPYTATLSQSIQQSWNELKKLFQTLDQYEIPNYFPYPIYKEHGILELVKKHSPKLKAFSSKILKKAKNRDLSHRWSVKDLLVVNAFIRMVHVLRQEQQRLAKNYAQGLISKTKVEYTSSSINQLLYRIQERINQHSPLQEHAINKKCLSSSAAHDLKSRLQEIQISLETHQLVNFKRYELEKIISKSQQGIFIFEDLEEYFQTIAQEVEYIDLLIVPISPIKDLLQQIQTDLLEIAVNLGQSLRQAYKSRMTFELFFRVTDASLESAGGVVEVLDKLLIDLEEVKSLFKQAKSFQNSIENFVIESINNLKHVRKKITYYQERLHQKQTYVKQESNLTNEQVHATLTELFESGSELTDAVVPLHGLSQGLDVFLQELSSISTVFQQIVDIPSSLEDKERLTSLKKVFVNSPFDITAALNHIGEQLNDLEWLLEENLIDNLEKETTFQKQVFEHLEPLQVKAAESTRVSSPLLEMPPPQIGDGSEMAEAPEESSRGISRAKAGGEYDPFSLNTMNTLKDLCRSINSEKTMSILDVLEHPHTYFTLLSHLEADYEPNNPYAEGMFMEETLKSQSAKEFILNFLKTRFMGHGYFDLHGSAVPYDEEEGEFEKEGKEVYLKVHSNTMETPMNMFRKLIRILLGYEDPDALNKSEHGRLIELLREDHILNEEEQIAFQETLKTLT